MLTFIIIYYIIFPIDYDFKKYLRKGVNSKMSKVEVGENESLEKALRRFKKKIEREGVLKQLKARKHYEKPSERKRRKRRSSKTRF